MTTFTVNTGLVVDPTGSNVDTWADNVTNPDYSAIDGMLAGVQIISVASTPVTLTSRAGFTPTPGGGPTQSQNRVLRFTGALASDVRVTLPIPGAYVIENLTTGNFVLSFQGVTATEVIGTPQGEIFNIYNDGAHVRFVGLARMGAQEMWDGLSAMPAWVGQCTVKPYLLCDGAVYNFSDFPYLGARLVGNFGGNGITTFGVPDLRGRAPLAYDGTGTRITTAGCGINGQTLGASQDKQTNTLLTVNLPAYTPSGTIANGAITISPGSLLGPAGSVINQGGSGGTGASVGVTASQAASTFTGTPQGGTSTAVNNVQPSQVTGIWVIKS
jgi:microcystin-dependent protein